MYILVAIIGLLTRDRFKPLWGAMLWAVILVIAVVMKYYLVYNYVGSQIVFYATSVNATAEIAVYFVAGVFLWKCEPLHKPRPELGVVAIFILVSMNHSILPFIEGFLLSYAVLAVGFASTPILNAAGRYGDFSYGLYLYAFPMQQASFQLIGNHWGVWPPLLAATAATACCAYGSWHGVEKRALYLKPIKKNGLRGATAQGVQSPALVPLGSETLLDT